MLSKSPFSIFSQFVLALQRHEQTLVAPIEEEKVYIEQAQAFLANVVIEEKVMVVEEISLIFMVKDSPLQANWLSMQLQL